MSSKHIAHEIGRDVDTALQTKPHDSLNHALAHLPPTDNSLMLVLMHSSRQLSTMDARSRLWQLLYHEAVRSIQLDSLDPLPSEALSVRSTTEHTQRI